MIKHLLVGKPNTEVNDQTVHISNQTNNKTVVPPRVVNTLVIIPESSESTSVEDNQNPTEISQEDEDGPWRPTDIESALRLRQDNQNSTIISKEDNELPGNLLVTLGSPWNKQGLQMNTRDPIFGNILRSQRHRYPCR